MLTTPDRLSPNGDSDPKPEIVSITEQLANAGQELAARGVSLDSLQAIVTGMPQVFGECLSSAYHQTLGESQSQPTSISPIVANMSQPASIDPGEVTGDGAPIADPVDIAKGIDEAISPAVKELVDSVNDVVIEGKIGHMQDQQFKGVDVKVDPGTEFTAYQLSASGNHTDASRNFERLSPYTILAYTKVRGLNLGTVTDQRKTSQTYGLREFYSKVRNLEALKPLRGTVFLKKATLPSGASRLYVHQYQNLHAKDSRGNPTFFCLSFDISDDQWQKLESALKENPKIVRPMMMQLLPGNFEASLDEPTSVVIESNTAYEPSLSLTETAGSQPGYDIRGEYTRLDITDK